MILGGANEMNKVIVIGCPGSGKSTFSRALHQAVGLPLIHLDMLYWNADRTIVSDAVFRDQLQCVVSQASWIMDGNYASTLPLRLQVCDTVFFLDYPLEVCLDGIQSRKGKAHTDIPWIEPLEEEDEEFMAFVKQYHVVNRPEIMNLLNEYADKNIVVFQKRNEAEEYLNAFKKS